MTRRAQIVAPDDPHGWAGLLALLLAAAAANRRAATYLAHACLCSHLDAAHDLARDQTTRTRCSTTTGPTGERCACAAFRPITQHQEN